MALDCEQSLSFPSVSRAIERMTSRERLSREPLANLHNINSVPRAEDFRNRNRLLVVQCGPVGLVFCGLLLFSCPPV